LAQPVTGYRPLPFTAPEHGVSSKNFALFHRPFIAKGAVFFYDFLYRKLEVVSEIRRWFA
jgi:hypothetical protein